MTLKGDLLKALKNSVVPGIPQIASVKGQGRRCLKCIIFCFCLVGFFWQTYCFLDVYRSYPTVVDVEYYYPEEIEVPAVTVCSYNGIRSDLFCNRFPSLCYPNSSLEEFCEDNGFFCDPNHMPPENDSYPTVSPRDLPSLPREEYQSMGMLVHDIVIRCIIREVNKDEDCTSEYQLVSVFDTRGLPNNCYAFNSLWGKTKGAKTIRKQAEIVLHLKAVREPGNQFYTGTPFAIQLSVHSPYALLNPFREGISLDPCSNYDVYPKKQVNRLLPAPYTTACFNYTVNWLARSGKGPVTKRLCEEECILNRSVEFFSCVDPLYIGYPNTEKLCSEEPDNNILLKSCSDLCSPACDQEHINIDVQEHTHMTAEGVHEEDTCFSTVSISFSRMEMIKFIYQPKYETISVFSYIGSYLGLWLGISLMAACDLVEAVFLVGKSVLKR